MAQIGTIKIQTASGVKSLPVFDTADAGSEVYDMVRVQTPSGIGFVPFTDPTDAAFKELRISSQSYGVLAAHNEARIPYTMFDGFEDGDYSEWSMTDGSSQFSIDSSSPISGSYSLKADYTTRLHFVYNFSKTAKPYKWEFKFRSTHGHSTWDDTDAHRMYPVDNAFISIYSDGTVDFYDGSNTINVGTIDVTTTTTLGIYFDWNTSEYQVYAGGNSTSWRSLSGTNISSGVDKFEANVQYYYSSSTKVDMWWDDFSVTQN